jgi:hypothetical protein
LALAVAVVAFVVAGILAEIVFLSRAASSQNIPKPSEAAKTAFDQWVSDFDSRNVTGLGDFYAENATVTWTGNAPGLTGTYIGATNIKILYGSTIGKDTSVNASIANFTQKEVTTLDANMTFVLNVRANSTEVGEETIQANASQDWNYVGGQWQIVKEDWNYLTFDEQIFNCCVTTFPQWTAIKEGQNPNLVSDKSFEWNAGPYVAASVYAFLGGVAVMGVAERRRARRPGRLTN